MDPDEKITTAEFYCRLLPPAPPAAPSYGYRESGSANGLFTIETDHRHRHFVQLATPDGRVSQWRCTYGSATAPARTENRGGSFRDDAEVGICETMGANLVEWVLDGFNALVLSSTTSSNDPGVQHDVHDEGGPPGRTTSLFGSFEDGGSSSSTSGGAADRQSRSKPPEDPQKNDPGLLLSLFSEFFRETSRPTGPTSRAFRVGLSVWDVKAGQVRDHTNRPVYMQEGGSFRFDTFEIRDMADAVRAVRWLQRKYFGGGR